MIRDKEIENSIYILDILRNIGRSSELQASVFFTADDFEQGNLIYSRKDKQLLYIPKNIPDRYQIGQTISISFVLKETLFDFDSQIIDIRDNSLVLDFPKVFRSSFKRRYSRYIPETDEDMYILLNDGSQCEVKDINTAGVSFYSESLNLDIDDNIRNLCIIFEQSQVCIDARIKYIIPSSGSQLLYGTEFDDIDWFSNYSLFKYIFRKTYPDICEITDFSRETIYQLYEESDYFKLKPRKEIEISFNDMIETMNKIKIYPHIISNPVFYHQDKIYMGASALRIYNNTFLAQHLAAIPQSRLFPSSKTSVYLAINDYLLCNPYFKYYLTYFDATNKWHNKMYQSIGNYIDDENKFLYETIDYFECYYDSYDASSKSYLKCKVLKNYDEFISYANANLPGLYCAAHGYNHLDFEIKEMKQIYAMAGIYAQRQVFKITDKEKTVAYGVVELYSKGLNLYNVLDMIRLYIVDRSYDFNKIFIAAINECKFFFEKYQKSKFNIFVKLSENERNSISIKGVKYDFLVGSVMADRNGSVEYKNLFLNMTR
ncbi:MAG: hypothetical protein JXQ23_02025 [Clostridia bacterium]|nr:hypothetical protein [Clostridia bacterium]